MHYDLPNLINLLSEYIVAYDDAEGTVIDKYPLNADRSKLIIAELEKLKVDRSFITGFLL